MSLLGNLNDMKLADVLRLFAAGKKTGRLTVSGEEVQGVLRFQKGAIVHAVCGRLHGEEAVLDLFGWGDGELTFVGEEQQVTQNVTRGVDALILDGLRMGPTIHRMHEVISSDRVVFQMGSPPEDPEARYALGPLEWRILRVLDGLRDVREVVEASKVPRAEALRVLFEMAEAGWLEKVEPQKSLKVMAQGLFSKESAELDPQVEGEWKRLLRFSEGVSRVQVKGGRGTAVLPATFRAGLGREIHLPRSVLSGLGLREGEEATVRPAG
jgi:hypothetical protein